MAGTAFEVSVQGLAEEIRLLNGFAEGLEPAMARGVQKGLYRVEAATKGRLSGEVLHVRTGRLRNSVTASAPIVSGGNVEGRVGTNVVYARIHELGGEIVAKTGSYLKFQIDGQWVQVPRVVMPRRPYLQPSLDENRASIAEDIRGEVMALVPSQGGR